MTDWSYFDKFERVMTMYLPDYGEGETKGKQIVTAVAKLVYRFYNDGDVFDNTRFLTGWANDLSSYANWLSKHTGAGTILRGVWECRTEAEYSDLLRRLADALLDDEDIERADRQPMVGTIYECRGEFRFVEPNEWDDEDEDGWLYDCEEEDE